MKNVGLFLLSIISLNAFSQFNENSENFGIDHTHVSEVLMGGGVTFLDFNNDGLLDYYLTGGESLGDKLYLNIGHDRFLDYTVQSKVEFITSRFNTFGAITLDYNNDGLDDLFLTTFDKSQRNVLLKNEGNMQFAEVGAVSGIVEAAASTSATALDINKDGFLDLYVVNYIDVPGALYDSLGEVIGFDHSCSANFLYINNGDDTYTESAELYGVDDIGCGLAVISTDFDQDGYTDLLVANDFGAWVSPNKLYKNINGTSFNDVSVSSGMDLKIYGMGIAQGDIDKDGDRDYYVTNIGHNSLMINNGDGVFEDLSIDYGIDNTTSVEGNNTTGWGTFFVDFDNNGYLDLYVANGYISAAPFLNNSLVDDNKIYMNHDGVFTDLSNSYRVDNTKIHRGTAFADINNDGRIDFVTVSCAKINNGSRNSGSLVYYNRLGVQNWLQIDLEGTSSNRDAYGASISLFIDDEIILHEKNSGGSHASQNSPILHFGLGSSEVVDSIKVLWPSGLITWHRNVMANNRYLIIEGEEITSLGCNDDESLICYEHFIEGCTDVDASDYDFYAFISDEESCGRQEVLSATSRLEEINFGPNPFSDIITINTSENLERVVIYNMAGKELINKEILPSNGSTKLNFSNLEIGVYIMTFVDNMGNEISNRIIRN